MVTYLRKQTNLKIFYRKDIIYLWVNHPNYKEISKKFIGISKLEQVLDCKMELI